MSLIVAFYVFHFLPAYILHENTIFRHLNSVILVQMATKPKQPDILRTAKQIAALLAKSGLDCDQQIQSMEAVKLSVADATRRLRQPEGGAQ